jgi:autotransporter passenger strand-loop-strand repeat protein
MLTSFTSGDIVISVSGDGDGSGTYTDNQASPIVLEEINPLTGAEVGQMTLPEQTITLANGTVEYAISGEYGSSSEGSLELSGDGQSLVIAGYGVNDVTYNTGGAAVYGNAAEAQSTSVPGGPYTPVARVIADISYNGTVDTSTALFNVFNGNNPRSVATYNGSSFYISGQGFTSGTDFATQGLFLADDGAHSATSIDNTSDSRTVEIYNGQLFLSRDSKQVGGGELTTYGTTLPTGTISPTLLTGIGNYVTLTAAQENGVNNADVGQKVYLSPENYFFANATTLYIADGGAPKEKGDGDGGLQKWTYNSATGTWQLDYTLTDGLNLVSNSNKDGSSGLIGLTGTVLTNGTVLLYTTNETLADLDQTYLYDIVDTLSATTLPVNEVFNTLVVAAPDTNIRGVAFAPSSSMLAPTNITIASGSSVSGITVTSGGTLEVDAGGTAVSAIVLNGGSASIYGLDSGSYIAEGGFETVTGTVSLDLVYGTQYVAGGAVTNGIVDNNGHVIDLGGAIITGLTVNSGGNLFLQSGTASSTAIDGGNVTLAGSLASLAGVTFNGAGTIFAESTAAAGGGVVGPISGFTIGDVIDLTNFDATLTSTMVGTNTVETITDNGMSESYSFTGSYLPGAFALQPDGNGGTDLVLTNSGTVLAGQTDTGLTVTSGGTITVLAGGTIINTSVLAGGTVLDMGIASATTLYAGGVIDLSGGGTLFNSVLDGGSVTLQTPQDVINGSVAFAGAATIVVQAQPAAGDGDIAVMSGFTQGDFIDLTTVASAGAVLTSSVSGGNTIETITAGGVVESFTFAGNYPAGEFELLPDGGGGTDLTVTLAAITNSITVSSGQTDSNLTIGNGGTVTVLTDGMIINTTFLSGGQGVVSGTEIGSTIATGGTVVVYGAATADQIYGLQLLSGPAAGSTAIVSNETVYSGGEIFMPLKGAQATGITIESSGTGAVNGNATFSNIILNGGTLELESPKSTVLGGLTFTGTTGTILVSSLISSGSGNSETISGFGAGDVILIDGFGNGTSFSNSYNSVLGLTIETVSNSSNPSNEKSQSFTFAGSLAPSFFMDTTSGSNSEITAAPCFASGTRILTPRGEVQVQNLKVGDMVITREGEDKPIQWIGQRMLNLRQHPRPNTVQPIRIDAGAFNDATPNRDLVLSPDHALYLDGFLVPVKALVNGENIVQLNRATVTYYHLELESHEVIFADGTMVETYLESGNRGSFDNGGPAVTLHPDFAQTLRESGGCAPFAETGPVVDSFRDRAAARHRAARKTGTR